MSRPQLVPSPGPLVCGLVVLLTTGCLGEPANRSCADLPPDTPGCGADGEPPPDVGPVSDVGPDEGPPPDGGPDLDTGPDSTPGDDMSTAADMAVDGAADGQPDAMRVCEPGTSRPCGSDEGACQVGQQFCNAAGVYDACLGAVDPTDETCNGQDDDCNGTTDEGCDCVDDDVQACGTDVGECVAGEQVCAGGAWGPCEGRVDGSEEICDGLDNDCNAAIDDLPAINEGQLCSAGVGQCRAQGPLSCVGSVDGAPVCTAVPLDGAGESCNRLDDDCDGSTDEAVPTGRLNLYGGGSANPVRTAVASAGEFHGVAWVDDGRAYYGLALGEDWEIQPAEVGFFNGDDTIATQLSMASDGRGGFFLAAAYDGLGSGLSVLHLGGGGNEQDRFDVEVDSTDGIDITWAANVGYAVAFEDPDNAAGTQTIHVDRVDDRGTVTRYVAPGGQDYLREPSVVLVGGVPSVAAIRGDARTPRGELILATFSENNARPNITVIAETNAATRPDLAWLPVRQTYVLAWQETERGVEWIKVATINRLGEVVDRFVMPAVADAGRPSVVPFPGGRDGSVRVAITWDRSTGQGFNIDLGWLLFADRGWTVSPGVTRVFGEQGSTAGASSAFAPDGFGLGVFFTYDDTRSESVVLSSLPDACPQQP